MRKIKKGDEVIVIAGKDKNRRGEVLKVLSNGKVVVKDINVAKHHDKPNPQKGIQGGIVGKEAALDISNVALFNSETGKADRVGFREEDGKKIRFFKSNSKAVDV